MDFNWFFRKGFRNNPPQDVFLDDEEGRDFEGMFRDEGTRDSSNVPFINGFGDFDTPQDVFQRMDAMLNRIFSGSLASLSSEDFVEHTPNGSNPRAIMLKDPDCEDCNPSVLKNRGNQKVESESLSIHTWYKPKLKKKFTLKDGYYVAPPPNVVPFEQKDSSLLIDSDIDDKVAKHGLILDDSPKKKILHSFSFTKSLRTVHLPDGTVEQHRTFTDSTGNTTTTVLRSIGEQSYEVTTHSDWQGLKEKQENFTNLHENELSDFEKRWQNMKSGIKEPALDMQSKTPMPKLNVPIGDSSYLSLFKKYFGF